MTTSLPEQSPQQRRTARIAGWLMALTFLTAIPAALIFYDPVLNDTDYRSTWSQEAPERVALQGHRR